MPPPKIEPSRRNGPSVGEVLFVATLAVIGGFILWFVAKRSNDRVVNKSCAANVRQLGTALVMYCGDYSDTMPPYTNIESELARRLSSRTLPTNSEEPKLLRKALDMYSDAPNWYCPADPVAATPKYYLGIRHELTSYAFPKFSEKDGSPMKLGDMPVSVRFGLVWDAAGDRISCEPDLWFAGARPWASNHPDGYVNFILVDLSLRRLPAQWPGGGYLP